MIEIKDVNYSALAWVQPYAFRRRYELRWHEDVIVTLEWEKEHGSLAKVRSAAGVWTLKRSGFLRPRVTARIAGTEIEIAVFRPNWKGEGELAMEDGQKFYWVQNDLFWGARWAFRDERHRPVISFTLDDGLDNILKREAIVEADEAAAGLSDLPLLAALGWYLMLLASDDATEETMPVRLREDLL